VSSTAKGPVPAPPRRVARTVAWMPPTSFFLTSVVFHYLGRHWRCCCSPHIGVLGMAWLRIASAAVVFACGVGPGGSSPEPADLNGRCSLPLVSCWPR
jgi:threonine/homoserine efflux transporter RhtA